MRFTLRIRRTRSGQFEVRLSAEEREVFDLVRIQGLTHAESAALLGIATKTVQRRLNRALLTLAERLQDIAPL